MLSQYVLRPLVEGQLSICHVRSGFSSCFSVLSKYVFLRHLHDARSLAPAWDYLDRKSMLLHSHLICVELHFFYQVVCFNHMPHSTDLIII